MLVSVATDSKISKLREEQDPRPRKQEQTSITGCSEEILLVLILCHFDLQNCICSGWFLLLAQVLDVPMAGDKGWQVPSHTKCCMKILSFTCWQQASCTTGPCRKGQEPEIPEPSAWHCDQRDACVSACSEGQRAPAVNLPLVSTVLKQLKPPVSSSIDKRQVNWLVHVNGSNNVLKCFTALSIYLCSLIC